MNDVDRGPGHRLAAGVEYNGAGFSGWQSQRGVATVQDAVEAAFSHVADHRVGVVCAGRTDAGVHATGQVVHFDSPSSRTDYGWMRGANTRLPPGVSISWVAAVGREFHARFSARRRRYRYVILNRPVRPAIHHGLVSWEYRPLSLEPMVEAGAALLGRHDFSAYRAASCQSKNPVKTLYRLQVQRQGPWFWIDVEADGFLHHMVRNIAGVMLAIGSGEREPGWAGEVLASRQRCRGGVTAPPGGLYLVGIDYDTQLPEPPAAPAFW
jgi:tRNA pseudouridine38-40 synthase